MTMWNITVSNRQLKGEQKCSLFLRLLHTIRYFLPRILHYSIFERHNLFYVVSFFICPCNTMHFATNFKGKLSKLIFIHLIIYRWNSVDTNCPLFFFTKTFMSTFFVELRIIVRGKYTTMKCIRYKIEFLDTKYYHR